MAWKKISIDEALDILTKYPDRCGVNIINANDEESQKFNSESIQAYNMAVNALKALKRVEEGLQNSYCRYSLARESNGYGTVVWSDNLIPVDKVIEIIHNELDNFGGDNNEN